MPAATQLRSPLAAVFALAGTVLLSHPAQSSASLFCEAAQKGVEITIQAVAGREAGAPVTGLQGELRVRPPGVLEDLRALGWTSEHLTQSWASGRDLKLRLYREREDREVAHASVDLVIETTARGPSSDEYRGRFTLTIFDRGPDPDGSGRTIRASGPVRCSLG